MLRIHNAIQDRKSMEKIEANQSHITHENIRSTIQPQNAIADTADTKEKGETESESDRKKKGKRKAKKF